MSTINSGDYADRRTEGSLHRDGSVRASYYLHAAVLGILAGVGCVKCFGAFGGVVVAVAVGWWGVIEAIKKEEALNDKVSRPAAE